MSEQTPCDSPTDEKAIQPGPIPGRCGAHTRDGGYCPAWPVKGRTRCRMHGGAPGSGRPPKHGLYSKVLRKSLATKYEAFLNDPDYTSLAKELALARSLLSEYVSRFRDSVALTGDDIEVLAALIDKIGRLAERMNRIEARTALTAREIDLLSVVIIRELTAELDPERAAALWDRVIESTLGFGLPAPGQVIEGQLASGGDTQEA